MEAEIHKIIMSDKSFGYDLHIYQDKNLDEDLKLVMPLFSWSGINDDEKAVKVAKELCDGIEFCISDSCTLDETIIVDDPF